LPDSLVLLLPLRLNTSRYYFNYFIIGSGLRYCVLQNGNMKMSGLIYKETEPVLPPTGDSSIFFYAMITYEDQSLL
jgi:hypothetical protein